RRGGERGRAPPAQRLFPLSPSDGERAGVRGVLSRTGGTAPQPDDPKAFRLILFSLELLSSYQVEPQSTNMTLRVEDYETAAFFALVFLFELCERIWPARPLDRWHDLKLDVLSFAFAIIVNRLCNWIFGAWASQLTPDSLAWLIQRLQAWPSF